MPPARTRAGDAGYDLRCLEAFSLAPGERAVVGTGVAVALPDGTSPGSWCRAPGSRRGTGISVVNGPGLIDPNYRGEVRVVLVNLGAEPYAGEPGDRIAQLLLVPFVAPETARGRRAAGVGRRPRRPAASAPPAARRAGPLPSPLTA